MDAFVDPNVHHIVIQKSTQIGYNDAVVNNVIGYTRQHAKTCSFRRLLH